MACKSKGPCGSGKKTAAKPAKKTVTRKPARKMTARKTVARKPARKAVVRKLVARKPGAAERAIAEPPGGGTAGEGAGLGAGPMMVATRPTNGEG